MGRVDRSSYVEIMMRGPFLTAVHAEMEGQDKAWGQAEQRGHSFPDWSLILGREYGEALDAIGQIIWNRSGQPMINRMLDARSELIQMAAVAGQIVKVIDQCTERNKRLDSL